MLKVKMPRWWTETEQDIVGTTDGKVTYCCSSTPCYYVVVPEFEYEGYFELKDLEVIK